MAQAGIIHNPSLVTRNCAIAFSTYTTTPPAPPNLTTAVSESPLEPEPRNSSTFPSHVVLVNQIGDIVYSAPIQIPLPSSPNTNPHIPHLPHIASASPAAALLLPLTRITHDLLTLLTSRTRYCNMIVYWGHRDELALLGITNDATYVRNVQFQASMQRYAFIEDESLGEGVRVGRACREFLGFEIGEDGENGEGQGDLSEEGAPGRERKLVREARATMALFQLWSSLACKERMARSRILED